MDDKTFGYFMLTLFAACDVFRLLSNLYVVRPIAIKRAPSPSYWIIKTPACFVGPCLAFLAPLHALPMNLLCLLLGVVATVLN